MIDGVDLAADQDAFRSALGRVPQDDTVHAELPLRRSLRYAARLRLPGATWRQVDAEVDDVFATLDLARVADVRVSALSATG